MPRPETMEIIERLTPEEREELANSLLKRSRDEARSRAIVAADWLESCLKVAGERDLADRVGGVRDELRKPTHE